MKVSFFPKTKFGTWAALLFILMVLLVSYFFLMINVFDQTGGDTFFSNLNLTIPMIMAWIAGLFSFIFGLISLIKYKLKSLLVIILTIITFLITLYGILEVVVTH